MFRLLRWSACLLLAAGPLAAAAEVYRWVDEKGQVHYSQNPPPGVSAQPVGPPPPASAAPNQDSLNQALESEKSRAPERNAEAERTAQAKQQLDQQCRQTREQLAYMEEKTARRLGTTDDNGNVSRVTEEQFQARTAELKAFISEHCS